MPRPDSTSRSAKKTPPPGDSPETPGDNIPVVSRWQQLVSTNPESPGFRPLLSSLTSETTRSSTTELCDNDAKDALGLIDEVLRDGKIPSEFLCSTISTMRTLAYNSGQVPSHYQVDRQSLQVEPRVIANGAFAEVREGRLGDMVVAVRTLRTDRQTDHREVQKGFCKECIIWMNVSHPNLLELIAVDVNPCTGQFSMVSEMMTNGNINAYIRKNSANRHRLLEGAAAGLQYLHHRGIVHGDLKGQNILVTIESPPRARLADFGLSTFIPGGQGAATTTTCGGTPMFMAPELLCPGKFNRPSARPTQPTDIYALGMVIYEVLTGSQPFHKERWSEYEITYNVMNGVRPTKPANVEQIGFVDGTWELVQECWSGESMKRPTIDQVHTHLTCVAAYSEVVGPTPDKPGENAVNSIESGSSSHIHLFSSRSNSTDTTPPSPESTHSTVSTAPSSVGPIPSGDKKAPPNRSKFKLPIIDLLMELPPQRSPLTKKLLVDPTMMMNCIIPMPMMTQKPSYVRGLIHKVMPNRPSARS